MDICIGFNEDWSRPQDSVIDLVARTFRDAGYVVGINTPYSNSIPPAKGFEYLSIMIEVNKRLYLRDDTDIYHNTESLLDRIKCFYHCVLDSEGRPTV